MREDWWPPESLDRARLGPLAEDVVERCRTARDRQAFPHALLLIGPPGRGRELAAVEVAALLVDTAAPRAWADDPTARRVRAGTHPDVVAVRPTGKAARISIEQVRTVVEAAAGRPFEGDHRVWIVDGVEQGGFGNEAANAFLKTLEEPPPHVVFLLLAANPMAVLPTIRSRCQRLLLPGALPVARQLGSGSPCPELGGDGGDDAAAFEQARKALRAALDGELRGLVQLPERLADRPAMLATVAAAAVDLAAAASPERAGDLTVLAADLLRLERRAAALNLDPARQLLARLMAFHRTL